MAIVVPHLLEGGGVSSVARFLAGVLEEAQDFEPTLISLAMSSHDTSSLRLLEPSSWLRGVQTREARDEGRPYLHVGAVAAELEFARYLPRRALTQRLDGCDLVQVVAGTPAWALVAARTGRPVALQVATLASVERASKKVRHWWKPVNLWRRMMTQITSQLDRVGAKVPDVVFVENRWMEKTMAVTGPVRFAPPGVDTKVFRPAPPPLDNSARGYLVSVARFDDPRKRAGILFDAYARLCELYPDAPDLVLVGASAPSMEAWSRAHDLEIRHRVRFHEDVSTERLAELYRGASVFVLASAEEGLGIVFLEAQASGVPVVATGTRGAETAVRDGVTGLLSPVDDPGALAASLEALLLNPDRRRRMGLAARRHVERHFSRDVAGERYLREYRRLT